MRRRVWAILLLALVLCIPVGYNKGKSGTATKTTTAPVLEGGDRTAILSGYPPDILPLYKCTFVTNASAILYSWVDEAKANQCHIRYETDASQQYVLSHYEGVFTDHPCSPSIVARNRRRSA